MKVALPNGVEAWAISASKYVQESVRNVESHLKRNGMSMRRGTDYPFTSNQRPEYNMSTELDLEDRSYYALLIRVLCWMVEMGQLDFCCEVSMMSSYS